MVYTSLIKINGTHHANVAFLLLQYCNFIRNYYLSIGPGPGYFEVCALGGCLIAPALGISAKLTIFICFLLCTFIFFSLYLFE